MLESQLITTHMFDVVNIIAKIG